MNLKPRADLTVRAIDEEIVIVDREAGQVHQLNATASFIWMQFDGKVTTDEVTARVATVFDVDGDTAARDVAGIVRQLTALNLLVGEA